MLKKIMENIEEYANEWSANFFFNTRTRILNYYPKIDILKIYEKKSGKKYIKKTITKT